MENPFKGISWQVVDDYDKYIPYSPETPQIYIWDGDEIADGPVCDMGQIGDMNYSDALAKAKLIAAAPELLKALETLLNEALSSYDFETDQMSTAEQMALKAIEKALN